MKVTIETLGWCIAHTYQQTADSEKVELTLPFESMKGLCKKHDLFPELGCGEASYTAFKDWLKEHDAHKEKFYGSQGVDINSLVELFDQDLRNTAKIQRWGGTTYGE